MKCLNYLVLLTIISCGGAEVRQTLDNASYRTSGIEQYFMPELPAWANYSASGRCFKSTSIQYLDFPKIAATYKLSYGEMVELQAQYNDRLESYFRSTAVRFLKPMEEASFFSNTLEQVRGGVRHLKLPQVNEADVIWIDDFIAQNKIDEFKKMAASGKFDEKLPIIFSACLSKQTLGQWLSEHNLDQVGFYGLTAEWLNPHGSDLILKAGLRIELNKMFPQNLKLNIIAPSSALPTELITK